VSLAELALQLGQAALHAHMGEDATYQGPGDEEPTACTVVIDSQMDDTQLGLVGPEYRRACRIHTRAIQVALPLREGVVTVLTGASAGAWIVRNIRALTGGNWELLCGADEATSMTAPGAGWPGPLA